MNLIEPPSWRETKRKMSVARFKLVQIDRTHTEAFFRSHTSLQSSPPDQSYLKESMHMWIQIDSEISRHNRAIMELRSQRNVLAPVASVPRDPDQHICLSSIVNIRRKKFSIFPPGNASLSRVETDCHRVSITLGISWYQSTRDTPANPYLVDKHLSWSRWRRRTFSRFRWISSKF